jgi:hypothetical protein
MAQLNTGCKWTTLASIGDEVIEDDDGVSFAAIFGLSLVQDFLAQFSDLD